MKQNVGKIDKWVRLALALIVLILYLLDVISGGLAIVLGVLAVVFLLTSFLNFCPLYQIFGVNTCRRK